MSKVPLSEAKTYTGQYNDQAGQHRTVIYEHFPHWEAFVFQWYRTHKNRLKGCFADQEFDDFYDYLKFD